MKKILELRENIYNHFQGSKLSFEKLRYRKDYGAYYTSMYLLQDTTEAIFSHREKGFNKNNLLAYIEFWGVMQALIIQQDAIEELYKVVLDLEEFIKPASDSKWIEIRNIRNICAGHPARKDRNEGKKVRRSCMGRGFGDYSCITYETCWDNETDPIHPTFSLAKLIDEYEDEAVEYLKNILEKMRKEWPLDIES